MTAPKDFDLQKPEFSRVVQVGELGDKPLTIDATATAQERIALAQRFNIEDLDSLEAHVSLSLRPDGDVHMQATFTAHFQQTCTVTLAPMKSKISGEFTRTYSPNFVEYGDQDEDDFEAQNKVGELVDLLIDEKIDIGEAVAEQFFLEIDPFPRVKGTMFDGFATGPAGEAGATFEQKNPFAVLSQLKTKQKNNT